MREPLSIMLVDDEPLAIRRLSLLLSQMSGVIVSGTASSGSEAVSLAETLRPDVCLLDIDMPEINGLEAARRIVTAGNASAIIFITAFDRFALEAFEVEAADYLLKPVSPDRLDQALEKVRKRLKGTRVDKQEEQLAFWVTENGVLSRLGASQIDRVSAERDYVRLHSGSKSWLINDSMNHLEDILDAGAFVRIHRSTIIRRQVVTGFKKSLGSWSIVTNDGLEFKVGRKYTAALVSLRNTH